MLDLDKAKSAPRQSSVSSPEIGESFPPRGFQGTGDSGSLHLAEHFAAIGRSPKYSATSSTSQMKGQGGIANMSVDVLFIAGFGPINRDIAESRALYGESLGITFKEDADGYLYTGSLQGAKHFALWPLSQATRSCFGTDSWAANIPIPQAWLEFEVENVETATGDLESQGYRMLIRNKRETWGQTVSRFLSPEGLLIAVTFTPSLRKAT